jgi:hypothetical protein
VTTYPVHLSYFLDFISDNSFSVFAPKKNLSVV